ncbi:MAG: class I SAM-dependent methyltransferase [Peptococcaceae bacterium]|nr:class I SAM-dependent methyltransferase [Candidatus Syntrophopropionicum ammoniitolerans]
MINSRLGLMFKFMAPFYDQFIRFTGVDHSRLIPTWLAPVEDREVLDLGGGTGINAAALYRSGARVTIADASPAMLKKAAGKNMQVRLVQALAEDLPLPDSSFDIVLISDAWHHFTDQAGAAAEVARVLRPTGRLYIIDFDPRQKITKTIAFVEGLLAEPATFTSPDELVPMLEQVGITGTYRPLKRGQYIYKGTGTRGQVPCPSSGC